MAEEDQLVDLDAADEEAQAVAALPARRGFLPIRTHWFDRLFIVIYIDVAVILLWMRFLEQAIPIWICYILLLALSVIIIRKG